jgi:hypothetical protein
MSFRITSFLLILLVNIVLSAFSAPKAFEKPKVDVNNSAISHQRQRVIVTTDIGGTDPDDFQSMVHLLLYSDTLDIEGLISSPFGPGRKEHILQVIDYYEKDYPKIMAYSGKYPTPKKLRAITKQGAFDTPGPIGVGKPTEGSEWIIRCAHRDDPRPLNILVWGGIEDLAQALHDAPDILPKLRVFFIGGPNKKWSVDAYNYIANNHKNLWIIESNDTYRGWFTGGNQSGEWGNKEFVAKHIAGHGALGDFFNNQLGGTIKMGDTPSVGWLLRGTPNDPSKPSWGGIYVRAWERPHKVFRRITNNGDSIEQFGVLEIELPISSATSEKTTATLKIESQLLIGLVNTNGTIEFLFSPKDAKTYTYSIQSTLPEIDGKMGSIKSYRPKVENKLHPASDLPNWWTDDPSPEVAEGVFLGAKTVSQWRCEFLDDFAKKFLYCKSPVVKSDKK